MLRWIYDFNGKVETFLEWSLDGIQFRQISQTVISAFLYQTPRFDAVMVKFAIRNKWQEPLAFDILKEAQSLVGESPRSALILLAVALEVGAKTYITKKSASCGKMLEMMKSSPAMDVLINSFIPTLDPGLEFSTDTKKLIKALFNERNSLVHGGSLFGNVQGEVALQDFTNVSTKKMWDFSKLVQDVLYHFQISLGIGSFSYGTHIIVNRLAS